MAGILRAYNSALLRRPMVTQMSTAAFLFGAGDVLAQQAIEKKGRQHDLVRTGRLSFYGGMIFAPLLARWFKTLEYVKFKSNALTIATRVGLDQFFAAPSILVVFFTSMSLMEGLGMKEGKLNHRIEEKWAPTVFKSWLVFIPVQVVNFAVMPAQLRLLNINIVSLFWNCYLSYANASQHPTSLTEAAEAGEQSAESALHKAEGEVKRIV